MGIRETLNQKPAIVTGVTIGIVVLALAFIVYQMRAGNPANFTPPSERYYSDDDGATYFADSVKLMPPYDHNGKEAVMAYVYQCKSGAKFVGYLLRYTPKALKAFAAAQTKQADDPMLGQIMSEEFEVSLPLKGPKGWFRANSASANRILEVHCPGGGTDIPDPISP